MIAKREQLSSEDLRCIVEMHAASLENSILSPLGSSVLTRYYHFVADSLIEQLFLVRNKGEVIGVCVLSAMPDSMTLRMVRENFFFMVPRLVYRTLCNFQTLRKVCQFLFCFGERPKATLGLHEVVQIYTNPSFRDRKVGTKLLEEVEQYLYQNGVEKYFLKTLSDSENAALHFYRKRGFSEVGERLLEGKHYVFFEKSCKAI